MKELILQAKEVLVKHLAVSEVSNKLFIDITSAEKLPSSANSCALTVLLRQKADNRISKDFFIDSYLN